MSNQKIYQMSFSKVYPAYVNKAQKKGRSKEEVDQIIKWLTDYTQKQLESELKKETSFEKFFTHAPKLNPFRELITGSICGVKIENIEEPLMKEIRYLDKMIDELPKVRRWIRF